MEVEFWSDRMGEHCAFLSIALTDDFLRRQAESLNIAWQGENDLDTLIEETFRLKEEILSRIENGEWVGFLYPSFVRHMILELRHLEKLVNGKQFSTLELAEFWKIHNQDYQGLVPHLLDPSEEELIEKVKSLGEKPKFSSEKEQFIYWSLHFARELDRFNKQTAKIKPESIIHPMLLRHETLEIEFCVQQLK